MTRSYSSFGKMQIQMAKLQEKNKAETQKILVSRGGGGAGWLGVCL